jgi:hypothetical protein
LIEVVSGKINFVEPSSEWDIAQKVIDFHNNKYEIIPEKRFYWKDNIEKTLLIYNEVLWK